MNERPIPSSSINTASSPETMEGFARIPGFLCRWEIPQVIHPGVEFVIEDAGKLDGVAVFRVFQRLPKQAMVEDVGIAVSLTFDGESTPLPARILPISVGEPLMAVLVLDGCQREAATLARVREHLASSLAKSGLASGFHPADARAPVGAR